MVHEVLQGVLAIICLMVLIIVSLTIYKLGYEHGLTQNVDWHAGASEGNEAVEYSCWSYGELGKKERQEVRCKEIRLSGQE